MASATDEGLTGSAQYDSCLIVQSGNKHLIGVNTTPTLIVTSSDIQTNTINERTASNGVLVASVLCKAGDITLSNNSAQAITCVAASSGNDGNALTVSAGDGNGTDKQGGALALAPGKSTGTGQSIARIRRLTGGSATGSGLNSVTDALIVPSQLFISGTGITTTPIFEVSLAAEEAWAGLVSITLSVNGVRSGVTIAMALSSIWHTCAINRNGTVTATQGVVGTDRVIASSETVTVTTTNTPGTAKCTFNLVITPNKAAWSSGTFKVGLAFLAGTTSTAGITMLK